MLLPLTLLLITVSVTALVKWRQEFNWTVPSNALAIVAVAAVLLWGLEYVAVLPLAFRLPVHIVIYAVMWVSVVWGSELEIGIWGWIMGATVIFGWLLFPDALLDLMSWGIIIFVPMGMLMHGRRSVEELDLPLASFPGRDVSPEVWTPVTSGHAEMPKVPLTGQYAVLECLAVGVVVGDADGIISFVNSAGTRLIGEPPTELVGQSMMIVLARLPMIAGGTQLGTQKRFEMNGRLIEGEMRIIYDSDDHPEAMVAILSDITDAHQSERAKTAFLTNVSHELRTPLTAIQGYVELLGNETGGQLNETQQMFIDTIRRNVSRMVQLINSLIFVSAVRGGRIEGQGAYADMRQIVRQLVRELEPTVARSQLKMAVYLDPQLTPIQADSIHVTTMLQELLNNSIKYSESGGTIGISVKLEGGQDPENSFVVIQVSDDGIGIDASEQLNIFDDFYRTEDGAVGVRNGGMGVGLSIVRALVEAYNGRIWLESAPGAGSTFTFVLPAKQSDNEFVAIPSFDDPTSPTERAL